MTKLHATTVLSKVILVSSFFFSHQRLLIILLSLALASCLAIDPYVPSVSNVGNVGGYYGPISLGASICAGITAFAVGIGVGVGIGAIVFDRSRGFYRRGGLVRGGAVWYGKRRRRREADIRGQEDEEEALDEVWTKVRNAIEKFKD